MVEVGFVDIEVHHAGVGTAYLGDVGITETTTHLGGTAPVLDLSLYLRIATFNHTCNHGVALAGTLKVGYHLAHCTAGVEFAKPGGNVGMFVVGRLLLLHVDENNRHVKVAYGR